MAGCEYPAHRIAIMPPSPLPMLSVFCLVEIPVNIEHAIEHHKLVPAQWGMLKLIHVDYF